MIFARFLRRHDHFHHYPALDALTARLDQLLANQEAIMATLEQVLQDVTEETGRLDSLSTLISGLRQQLADALSGTTLPPATQAKVDAIFAAAETNKGLIDKALNAGVPPIEPSNN